MNNNLNYEKFNIGKLGSILKGRIEPKIYAFKTNVHTELSKYIKVGDTYRDVETRLLEWEQIYNDIGLLEENGKKINPIIDIPATLKENKNVYFRDISVHKYLDRFDGKKKSISEDIRNEINKDTNLHISKEFFRDITKKDIVNAIDDIDKSYYDDSDKTIKGYEYFDAWTKEEDLTKFKPTILKYLRDNQKEVVDRFVEKYNKKQKEIKNGNEKKVKPLKLLMYAVMRFGKTFTALSCAKAVKAKIVVVLSGKKDVHDEWQQNVEEAINFKNYKFVSKIEGNLKDFNRVLNGTYIDDLRDENGKKFKGEKKDGVVVFLTLQDLQGGEIKKEHKEILNSNIDILIVDETHFGARADSYGRIIRNTENEELKKKLKDDESNLKKYRNEKNDEDGELDEYYEVSSLDENIKAFKSVKCMLHLSGTPYRILLSNEFPKENRIAEVTYADILNSKKEWDDNYLKYDKVGDIKDKKLKERLQNQLHLKDQNADDYEIKESDNPYFGFPNMIRFGYNPSEEAKSKLIEIEETTGAKASVSTLFEPKHIKKEDGEDYNQFKYEPAVLDILYSLDGKKHDRNVFPILKYEKDQKIVLSRHIVMVLPYCASCDAMQKLLESHVFENLSEYEIINISGLDIKNEFKKVENIKNFIKQIELRNFKEEYIATYSINDEIFDRDISNLPKKSITLTVERMLTGTTVPEWDTMIFLKDTVSPEQYDQAIYRLQNKYIKTYRSENGEILVRDMKPQTLLIDFNIERMFSLTEEKSFIYNKKDDKIDNIELSKRIETEIKNSPIFVSNDNQMVMVNADDIMEIAARYNSKKSIIEEASEVDFDIGLLDNDIFKEELDKQKEYGESKGGLSIVTNQNEDNTQDLDFLVGNADYTYDEKEFANIEKNNFDLNRNEQYDVETKEIEAFKKKWATYCSRLLFYAFLTKSKIGSIEEILNFKNVDKHNSKENERLITNLQINLNALAELKKIAIKYSNYNLIHDLSYKIMNINKLSHDEYKDLKDENGNPLSAFDKSIKKIQVAMDKFSRLGESEIVTPPNVCDDMINQFTSDRLKKILISGKKILDINSKLAEFSISIVRHYKNIGILVENNETLKNLLYSIPSASYTYEFTRYVYEKLGLNVDNIATKFCAYDLVGNSNVVRSEENKGAIKEQKKHIEKNIELVEKYNSLLKMQTDNSKDKNLLECEHNIQELLESGNINEEFIEEYERGLFEELNILSKKMSEKIDYEKICRILNQNKKFCEISLNDKVEGEQEMKFDVVVGNPPYQETVGNSNTNKALAKQLFPDFVMLSMELTNKYATLITPSKWFTGDGQDNSFPKLREYIRSHGHISQIVNIEDGKSIFKGINISSVSYFLYDSTYNDKETLFVEETKTKKEKHKRELFIDGIDTIFSKNCMLQYYNKIIRFKDFVPLTTITTGRNPYGMPQTLSELNNVTRLKASKKYSVKTYCAYGEIRYLDSKYKLKKMENIDKYKVFISKMNGGAGTLYDNKRVNIIGESFVGEKGSVCSGALIALGSFDKKNDAVNLQKYMKTKFLRMLVGFKKSSQALYQNVYELVPLQDFSEKSDINWGNSIDDIDEQLFAKYNLTDDEKQYINEMINPMI